MSTAAVVIIGNEVLTGKFADENGPYLIGRLRTLGTDLVRLVTIPDDVAVIADEVRRCAAAADHVFTSGGVGPTHDDVTFEGVAGAFRVPLELRTELLDLIAQFGMPRNDGTERMARVPAGAELLFHEALSYPVVRVRNAYVLPGVPKLFRNKFEANTPWDKIAYGVRAIETETSPLSGCIDGINGSLAPVVGGFEAVGASLTSADKHLGNVAGVLGIG